MKKILLLISLILAAASAYTQRASIPCLCGKQGLVGLPCRRKREPGAGLFVRRIHGLETEIPLVPVKAVVPAMEGDATEHIQAALNYVSSLKPDQNGFRGAVLLEPGRYEVGTTLWINASGVVLRKRIRAGTK